MKITITTYKYKKYLTKVAFDFIGDLKSRLCISLINKKEEKVWIIQKKVGLKLREDKNN